MTSDLLRTTFRRIAPVPDEALAALERRALRRKFERGEWLLEAGLEATWCFLVERGLVRELYVDEQGREHTRRFLAEGEVTGSLLDLLSGKPSLTWIQALEPTATIAFRYGDFDALSEQFGELERVARRFAESLYVIKARREFELLTLPARERYALWLRERGGLDARVSQRQLASYLGITPEHLSRLRRRAGTTSKRGRRPRRAG